MGKSEVTDELIIKRLKKLYKENNRVPTYADYVNKYGKTGARRRNWTEWLKLAKISKEITLESLQEKIDKFFKENGRPPKTDECKEVFGYDKVTLKSNLGMKYSSIILALGYVPVGRRDKTEDYNKEDIGNLIKGFVESGEITKLEDMKKLISKMKLPTSRILFNLFGVKTLTEVLVSLGYQQLARYDFFEKEELIKAYKSGTYSSIVEFIAKTGIGTYWITKYFGNWKNMVAEINGKSSNPDKLKLIRYTYTREEVIKMYKELSISLGKHVKGATVEEFVKHCDISYSYIRMTFDYFWKLKDEAGFTYRESVKVDKEEVKKILKEKIKEIPSTPEYRILSYEEKLPCVRTLKILFQKKTWKELWEEILR